MLLRLLPGARGGRLACQNQALTASRRNISTDLRAFRPQELANFLESFAQLKIRDRHVCETFAREVLHRDLKTFPFQHLASILKSFAFLSHRNDRVNAVIAQECCSRFSSVPPAPQPLIDMMWALACMDSLKLSSVYSFFHLQYGMQTSPPSTDTSELALRVLETRTAWTQAYPSYPKGPPPLLMSISAPDKWVEEALARVQSERQMSTSLKLAHALLLEKYPDAQAATVVLHGLPVDLLVNSKRAVVELYDPRDFFRDGVTMTGSVVFKQRLMLRANYRVYRMSQKDFGTLTLEGQRQQIQHLIKVMEEDTHPKAV